MKKILSGMVFACLMLAGLVLPTQAAGQDTIREGIYAGNIALAGMTGAEAGEAVDAYIEELKETEITLVSVNGEEVVITAGELGLYWANPGIMGEAIALGKEGNILERYMVLADLKRENKVYDIELGLNMQAISDVLTDKCAVYDQKAVNASLVRENGTFTVQEGQIGYAVDVERSIDLIYDYVTTKWDHKPCRISLEILVDEPKGSEAELSQVKDVLGTFTTSYHTSGYARSANVANGVELINGTTLYPGEEFSTYETVSPFSERNGYYMAGSYLNGKVVDSLGGGICQVSTTLYNAVLKAELEVTERHNHSMIVGYVEPSADAAIAESSGKDFKFVNNTDTPVYIEGYTTSDKKVVFTIYGKETRKSNRTVIYESKVLEVIHPETEIIYQDGGQPIGYVSGVESAHIGYKAQLWKVVKEDGVEVSRTQINSSSYKMVPRSVVVGTATADPNAYNEMMAAIGTGSIDHVRNVVAILTAAQAADPNQPVQ